ncbi:Y-family DNA polymerase [Ramlibacter alkalitolerans]|uniref:DNA polymerase Y family protein n=1 Tax=Ramlibacter alkalitolerans TaxID=2039631 RepID=A0ABS1JP02_9BURK|nr:DNA polymerase Y family protein [Ramlibacter alkalitolerans]MBL0425856.1 DNA polymerase Y family protein [Ramlibacter alkalitolerans]
MYWIALQASPDEDRTAWGWRALQFTPRVAFVDEAILLEAGASERLFGGRRRLLRSLLKEGCALRFEAWAAGPTALVALSLLRMKRSGAQPPAAIPDDLPLATLTAAAPHLATLERIGCSSFGQLRALPRAGVSRRFGAELLQALDSACGQRPERYPWLTLPPEFDQKLELPALATSAQDLLFTGQHLLTRLQSWLQGRNLGVLALELEWTLDLRRLDGKPLPPNERLELRTAQPTQEIRHLRRLASEQLARTTLAAPANALRLRTLETVPWGGVTTSLLPEENKPGEKLHQLVERLSVRLGEQNVSVLLAQEDHRPECMQRSVPARSNPRHSRAGGNPGLAQSAPVARSWIPACAGMTGEALFPPWILRQPLKLQVKGDKPWYQGPLQLLTRARRLEAAWWDPETREPVLRDYFIARSVSAGLLWVFRERLAADQDRPQWFLHGLYA